jgi:hypothetical protein
LYYALNDAAAYTEAVSGEAVESFSGLCGGNVEGPERHGRLLEMG